MFDTITIQISMRKMCAAVNKSRVRMEIYSHLFRLPRKGQPEQALN